MEQLRRAAFWGVAHILTAVAFLFAPLITMSDGNSVTKLAILVVGLVALHLTYAFHIGGYTALGYLYGSRLLRIAGAILRLSVLLSGVGQAVAVIGEVSDASIAVAGNATVGAGTLAYLLGAAMLFLSLLKLRNRLRVLGLLSPAVVVPFFFLWRPWLSLVMFMPSILLMLDGSRGSGDA